LSDAVYTTITLSKIVYKDLAWEKNRHFRIPWLWTSNPYNVFRYLAAGGAKPKPLPLVCWL